MSTELNTVIRLAFDGAEAQAGIDATSQSTTALDAALERLAAVLDGVSASLDAFAGSLDGMSVTLDESTASVTTNTGALVENDDALRANIGSRNVLLRTSRMLIMPLGLAAAAVIAIGAAALDAEQKYTSAMSVVQSLTGQSTQTMKMLNVQVMQMATDLGTAPTPLAQGLYFILSSGVHSATEAMALLRVVTMASASTFVDAQTDAQALTHSMNAYGASTSQAMYYQNILIQGVVQGETTMQQYGNAMAVVSAYAARAGYSFNQTAAAVSTMTMVFPTGRRAATDLAFLLRQLGINTDKVAEEAKKMGLNFDETKFKTMDLYHQLQYLQSITHGNTAELLKLTGGATGFLAFATLMTKGGQNFYYILNKMKEAGGLLQKAWAVHTQTIGYQFDKLKTIINVAFIRIGAAIQPVAVAFIKSLIPALTNFSNWVSSHGPEVAKIFATLAAVLTSGFLVALGGLVAGFIALNGTLALIVVGVMAAAGAVSFLVLHFQQVSGVLGPVAHAFQAVLSLLAPIGNELKGQLGDVMAQLGDTIKTSLLPAWKELQPVLIQLKPVLLVIAAVLGFLLITAIGVLVAALTGLIKAFGALLSGVIKMVGGMVFAIASAFKLIRDIVGGVMQIIGDLIAGHWTKASRDTNKLMNQLKNDVLNILHGLWTAIEGIFQAGWGAVAGLVSGFMDGIIGFFNALFDSLVGHSIIPDMIEAIIHAFMGLEARGLHIVGRMFNRMVHFALSAGPNIMHALTSGLLAGMGSLGSVLGNIAGKVAGFFPHSPAKEGPLVGWEHVGAHMIQMLATSMQSARAALTKASGLAAATIGHGGVAPGAASSASSLPLLQSILRQLQQNGAHNLGPGGGAGILSGNPASLTNNWGGLTFNGVSNINALAQSINQIHGLILEMSGRGMVGGPALS